MRIDNFKSNLGFLLGLSSCGRNLLTFPTARLSNLTAKNVYDSECYDGRQLIPAVDKPGGKKIDQEIVQYHISIQTPYSL